MTDDPLDKPGSADALGIPEWMRPVVIVGVFASLMWVVELIDLFPGTNLDRWGLRPRELEGLVGIVTMPLLHGGFGHLISNTIPFVIMGSLIAASSVSRYFLITAIITLVSGVGTWLIGPGQSVHIGASALVFGYLTYLLTRGLFDRKPTYLLLGIVVLFLYGGVLWGILPRPGISWQGHLLGAVGGVAAARVVHAEAVTTRRSGAATM